LEYGLGEQPVDAEVADAVLAADVDTDADTDAADADAV
jgi:hypothetical protein